MSETNENTQPEAANELEKALIAGKDGEIQPTEIIQTFLTSTVYFLTQEAVTEETGLVNPLTLQDNDGNPLIAVFSSTEQNTVLDPC